MYVVYILESEKTGKYYTGYTRNIDERIACHNAGKVKSTRSASPWKIVYTEEHHTQRDAMAREMQIKSWKRRKAIEKLIHGPIV